MAGAPLLPRPCWLLPLPHRLPAAAGQSPGAGGGDGFVKALQRGGLPGGSVTGALPGLLSPQGPLQWGPSPSPADGLGTSAFPGREMWASAFQTGAKEINNLCIVNLAFW